MTLFESSPLYYAIVVELGTDHGLRFARVRAGGAIGRASIEVLPDAAIGDQVLVHAGVVLARVAKPGAERPEVA